eukprot:COSAG02_NODE_19479_length_879_cov_4.598718_1_plen_220_part_00
MMIAVGLILGTRIWYAMWDVENDDEAAFERRVDSVTREIGERGKLNVPESVPPVWEAAPTPAPAPARAVAPGVALAPSLAPAPAPALSSTTGAATAPSPSPTSTLVSQPRGTAATMPNIASSVQEQQVSSSAHVAASGMGASLMEVSAFMTEQHAEMIRLLVERETQARAEKVELEAKLEAQRQKRKMNEGTTLSQRISMDGHNDNAPVIGLCIHDTAG